LGVSISGGVLRFKTKSSAAGSSKDLLICLVERLERRVSFSLSVTDRKLYSSIRAENLAGTVVSLHGTWLLHVRFPRCFSCRFRYPKKG
jgi:hypothetical protein